MCQLKQGERGLQGLPGPVPTKDIEKLKQLVGNLMKNMLVSQSVVWLQHMCFKFGVVCVCSRYSKRCVSIEAISATV